MGQKATPGVEPGSVTDGADGAEGVEKKLDLSVAQIAGSSLATVAAALLASKLGVYGTILGAGVVSVVATAGGPVIQHFFKRTGDQLRESARPRARQVPPPGEEKAPDGTLLLRATAPSGEFGAATVHGTRVRGWKRTAVASGAAFAIALGGLGAYEAFSGTAISRGGGTIWSGGTHKVGDERPAGPGKESGTGGKGGATPDSGASPSPSAQHGGRGPSPSPSPDPSSPDSSDSGGPAPSPSPPTPTTSPKPTPTPTPTPKPTPTPAPSGKGQQQAP
ncbi:hypothetical protein ADK52_21575 [Streptomyces sp. WM6372]|uniref:hypothetical protein n=1 Tax=Streptomyces sp. WM6372 TaxID=1415555 RepID=UPI0006C697A4|nr:hypothetical protein [Streptomyces sp. WM6372]KOU22358.1 hypothetical protein ADK52_21575 [Streptomyces sp. WM6372]